jgi:hypothetical protein
MKPRVLSTVSAVLLLAATVAAGEQPYVEVTGVLGIDCSLVELKDGTLLSNRGLLSRDGGLTWKESRSFGEGVGGSSLVRLQDGAILLVGSMYGGATVFRSDDDGVTWAKVGRVKTPEPQGGLVFDFYDPLVQLHSGRLLYPWDIDLSGNQVGLEYARMTAKGTWRGKEYAVEGHTHVPEFYGATVSWSDDGGKSWSYDTANGCPNSMFGWFDFRGEVNGMAGCTPFGESTLAQCNDGRVLWVGRSTVGRIAYTYSSDDGKTWEPLRPLDLVNSNSPPRLRRIPATGDLLMCWNQVSPAEIAKGYRRGRLSVAISKDCGKTWVNFRTIEVSDGLRNRDRVRAAMPIRMTRARQDVGELADGFRYFHYPNVCFAGNKVYVLYNRGGPEQGNAEQVLEKQVQVLRIYPLEYFCGEAGGQKGSAP